MTAKKLFKKLQLAANDDVIDLLYDEVDALLCSGQFEQVNSLLDMISPSDWTTTQLLAFISIAFQARSHVPAWSRLMTRVRQHLTEDEPDRVDDLLRGFV